MPVPVLNDQAQLRDQHLDHSCPSLQIDPRSRHWEDFLPNLFIRWYFI
jgi:hypothetical protein